MPDISLSGHTFFPYSNNETPTGDQVSELAYYARATPDTLEVINGRLDEANLDSTATPLEKDLVRDGHLSYGTLVSSSMNQDVFAFLFQGIKDTTDLNDDDIFDAEAVPVLGTTFYVQPGTKYVCLSWNIGVVSNGSSNLDDGTGGVTDVAWQSQSPTQQFARWRLFVDDAAVRSMTRDIRDAIRLTHVDSDTPFYGRPHAEYPDTRWWAGSYIIEDPSVGWHTASIRYAAVWRGLAAAAAANTYARHLFQGRVRARRMGYVARK